jgi:ATP-dependent DNA ligase
MTVLVHKAVEPDKLTRKGKKRLEEMLLAGEYIVQPKLDGVYCQIVREPLGAVAYSRTGEILRSVPEHVMAQFSHMEAGWRFIGELWRPHTAHSTINGMARKQSPQDLELHLFDALVGDEVDTRTYGERYNTVSMQEWRRGVEVVRTIAVPDADMETLYELATEVKARRSAYDGLVLKDSMGLFTPGAGKDGGVVKIKSRNSGDFRVVGTTPGLGMREGGIGALVLDLGGGVTCEVGTGLTLAEVMRDPAEFVGRIVEVEYLDVTRDGRLREPAYKSVRFDKEVADVLQ